LLRIPGVEKAEIKEIEQVKTDTAPAVAEALPVKINRSSGYTEIKELRGSLNVAVLLPFYLSENSNRIETDSSNNVNGRKTYRVPEDWIYPGSLDFLEMYEGILLASDTLRSLGLKINLHTYDI